ncbi:MAG TPA: hypothetical protein VKB52_13855 [Rhodanobacteraceae bacterium]|nr:hypothetical protein [Rhodanobacteraceae bacterium]
MSRLYVYKIRYDDGTAPCVEGGLLSLALCKPAIRATAAVGDTIVAFAAKSMCRDQRLVFAAEVTAKIADGAYYRAAAWRHRRDAVYCWRGGAFERRRDAAIPISDADMQNDLGDAPSYRRASVLLSDNYRYFADTRAADYRAGFPTLAAMIDKLGQGHRVHHGERVRDEIERYLAALWNGARSVEIDWTQPDGNVSHPRRSGD